MGLQAEAPIGAGLHKSDRKLLALGAVVAGLEQQQGARRWVLKPVSRGVHGPGAGGGSHGQGEIQIGRAVHHHLELIAAGQQLSCGRPMGLGGEGDPVEVARERVDAAGFQVQGQAGSGQGGAEGLQVVFKRFPARDHHEAGSSSGGRSDPSHQLSKVALGMDRAGPGVFGVTPGATHRAAG